MRFQLRRLLLGWTVLLLADKAWSFDGLAVLGDSSSTGAAANPALKFDSEILWEVFNSVDGLPFATTLVPEDFRKTAGDGRPPVRLPPSSRENDGGSGWIWHHVSQAVGARSIEDHRLSYSNFLGRSLGLAPEQIIIAGENGTTSRHAWIHAARLVAFKDKDLPSRIIFFYSGNDLCGQSVDDITLAETYGEGLLRGMKYLVLNGHADARGTTIYIPAFMPVTSLLHEPSILEHKVYLHGEEVTCREARARLFAPNPKTLGANKHSEDPLFQLFSAFMPPSPVLFCPTLFSKMAQDSVRQSQLANRIRSFRAAQQKAVEDFNIWRGRRYPARAFDAAYIDATETLKFEGEDVAGDCFHLSASGQGKLTKAMMTRIR
jgi:hypothetical protein